MAETNGNGVVKRWHLGVSLAVMILALATVIFRAGVIEASMDARQAHTEEDVKMLQADSERKDLADERLGNIEKEDAKIEHELSSQSDTLTKILLEQQRRR
jgi:hypothetical protein